MDTTDYAVFADANVADMATVSTSGDFVVKEGIIWRCGDYSKTHDYVQTPEQLAAAVARFDGPIANEYIHLDTYGKEHLLEGEFGTTDSVRLTADGKALFARVSIPKWFNDIIQRKHGGVLPVSAVWDKKSHELLRTGFVKRGGVEGAAVFDESEQREITSARDAYFAQRPGATAPKQENGMKVFIPNANGSRSGTPEEVATFCGGTIGADTRGLQVQDEATGSMSKATPEQIVAFTAGAVKFAVPTATVDAETQAKLDRLAQFEADEATKKVASIGADAEAAYKKLLEDGKVTPSEREGFVAAFSAALLADANADTRKGVACFAAGSPTAEFSLSKFLAEQFARLPQSDATKEKAGALTQEMVAAFEQSSTTAKGKNDETIDYGEVNRVRAEQGMEPIEKA